MRNLRTLALLAVVISLCGANAVFAQDDPPPGPAADLLVQKFGPSEAAAGSDVSYTVTVINLGPDPAVNVVVDDPIPPGMTFVSATQNSGPPFVCTDQGGQLRTVLLAPPAAVSCTGALLGVGETVTFTFVFNIPPATPPGTTFVNIATASTQTGDPNEENNSGIVVTTTPPPPMGDVVLSKNGPGSAAPDTNVVYTIIVGNGGPDAAENLAVNDTLPGTMTFVSLQQSGTPLNCVTPGVGAGGTITCTSAAYPAGGSTTLTLTGHIPSDTATGTEFSNTAFATSTNDPNEENNVGSTTLIVSSVDLAVTKTGPANVNAGSTITYTLTMTNNGPDTVFDATLTDAMPAGTTFVSLIQNSGPFASCTTPPVGSNGTILCSVALGDDVSVVFDLVINTGTATSAFNTATTSTSQFDTNGTNNSASVATTINPRADVSVVKTGPVAPVNAGTNAVFTLTVTNNGPSTAANVVLTDTLPTNTTFVSLTPAGGPAFSCTTPLVGGTGTINCTNASLAAGASSTFTLTLRVVPSAPAGVISNTADVSTTTVDPDGADNSSTGSVTVTTQAEVAVAKNGAATVNAGQNLTYTVSATNNGPSDASTVTLTDPLPANTTFVSGTQTGGQTFACTYPAPGTTGTITCTLAAFAPGPPATFTFVVNVPSTTPDNTILSNTFSSSTNTPDPNAGNNLSTVNTTVLARADVAVTKTGPPTATAGSNVTYTITATNNGPSTATSLILGDELPADTTFVSLNQSGPVFTCTTPAPGTNGPISCTRASLDPLATTTFTLVVNVNPAATAGAIVNTATISTATIDPTPANNTSTTTANGTASADVAVTKTGPATTTAGSNITYTVTATNNGPSTAASIVLADTLPANATFVSLNQSGLAYTCTTPAVGATGTINCTRPSLAPAGSAIFTIVVNVNPEANGAVVNNATISATTTDPTPANNTAAATTVAGVLITDVSITKTADAEIFYTGLPIRYTITVANIGPNVAVGTTVTDILPAGTTFVSATPSQGSCSGTTTVTCALGTLASGASATIQLVINAPATPGPIANTATVTIANTDSNPTNSTTTANGNVLDASQIPAMPPLALAMLAMAMIAIVVWQRAS